MQVIPPGRSRDIDMAPTLFEKEPRPGDLIEIFRGLYQHWAVYVGHYEVIHLIPPSEQEGGMGGLFSLMENDQAQVRCQRLCDVVGSDHFKVNNLLDKRYTPREPRHIIREARRLVGQMRPYCFASNNCEHFVTELRYGRPESRQVGRATEAAIGGVAVVGAVALGALLFGALLNDDNKDRRHHN